MTETSKTPPAAKLSDYMCFTVYSANLAFSRAYKPVLEQLGVTYPQYVTIIALWEEDNQTVKGLAERLFLEPSTLTPMLQRLEAMGYLTRTRDTVDERVVRVNLTEAGRRLRQRAFEYRSALLRATGLPEDEFRTLQRAVARLRDNLMAAGKAEV